MDFSLLHTPSSDNNKQRTEVYFTVQSANSPSNSLTRRQGFRKPNNYLEDKKQSTAKVEERERNGTHTGTNGTINLEDHTFSGLGSWSRGGQYEDIEMSANRMSTKNGTEFVTNRSGSFNPPSESRGRTEWRRYNLPSRSKSLDLRSGERSPDCRRKTDTVMLSSSRGWDSKEGGGFEERTTGIEGSKGTMISSVPVINSVYSSNTDQDSDPLRQTLNRANRGQSFPSRLRSRSGPVSDSTGYSSLGSKGGQSIMERIEKLYGSVDFGKDYSNTRDFSTPGYSPKKVTAEMSYAGGTFPRNFASGWKGSLIPEKNRESFTVTKKDTSESFHSPGMSVSREKYSMGFWQGSPLSRGFEDIGTRSLDRARSRCTLAARIRSERAAGQIAAASEPNTYTGGRTVSWTHLSGTSGSNVQGRVNHGEERFDVSKTIKERTGWFKEQERKKGTDDAAKVESEMRSSIPDEDVFDSSPQKMEMERKKFPDMRSITPTASVKNKISQFEALTQRSQGLTTGQFLLPRRAFSVPTPLSSSHDGIKKSGSAKSISELKGRWERSKEGEEGGEKTGRKVTLPDKNIESKRSLSVDEVGLRLTEKEQEKNEWIENDGKNIDSGNYSVDFFKYPSLVKSTLEVALPRGAQRLQRNFHVDETDFSKVSSPEKITNRPPLLLLTSYDDTSAGVLATTPSPVSDEDKTPTNTPVNSPLTLTNQESSFTSSADNENESVFVLAQAVKTPEQESPPLPDPLAALSHDNFPNHISPDINPGNSSRKKPVLDLHAWVAGLNTMMNVDGKYDYEDDDDDDDDDSTEKDEDSNYDSDSGESSVTITSNMSQSERKSFSVSLSDLCNFAGVDYESENDSDEWQSISRRSASISSDMSAFSCVSVLPTEELDKLLEEVRNLGDNNLQDYNDVQVVVLHKEIGVGLGFSLAGGRDQNKPVTVHKVFPSGAASQEGSIKAGDNVLSINGTSLCDYAHWEALRVLRRAKARDMGVVVLQRGKTSSACKGATDTNSQHSQTPLADTGQRVCVRLEKINRDLGFSLEGGAGSSLEDRPLTVQRIFQGGPVDKVFPGDELLEIDGVSVVGMRRLEAWTLIRKLPDGPVNVVLHRSF
ncbi:serine-rich adhesin for platelets [Antennarius striatus]|uniref:serine-rich adhesin for platelets n=1 Tax=Antennarius striatus TaxID=241820 RepID=UPI0035AF5D96